MRPHSAAADREAHLPPEPRSDLAFDRDQCELQSRYIAIPTVCSCLVLLEPSTCMSACARVPCIPHALSADQGCRIAAGARAQNSARSEDRDWQTGAHLPCNRVARTKTCRILILIPGKPRPFLVLWFAHVCTISVWFTCEATRFRSWREAHRLAIPSWPLERASLERATLVNRRYTERFMRMTLTLVDTADNIMSTQQTMKKLLDHWTHGRHAPIRGFVTPPSYNTELGSADQVWRSSSF